KIAKGMKFTGVFNIQFVLYNKALYVLEVNPRASRTVPVTSKVTNVNLIELATKTLLGEKLANETNVLLENEFYTVKASVFSTAKLPGVDPNLEPVMKSTGEVIAVSERLDISMAQAFIWNETLQQAWRQSEKEVLISVDDEALVRELTQKFNHTDMTVVTRWPASRLETIEEWMKSEAAIAIVSTEKSNAMCERAEVFDLIVIASVETAGSFASTTNDVMDVVEIIERKENNQ